MASLNKAKEVIDRYIVNARYGIFNTRNWAGDTMETIYDDGELQIDICWFWEYFEVFGLSEEQFCDLEEYYTATKKMVNANE